MTWAVTILLVVLFLAAVAIAWLLIRNCDLRGKLGMFEAQCAALDEHLQTCRNEKRQLDEKRQQLSGQLYRAEAGGRDKVEELEKKLAAAHARPIDIRDLSPGKYRKTKHRRTAVVERYSSVGGPPASSMMAVFGYEEISDFFEVKEPDPNRRIVPLEECVERSKPSIFELDPATLAADEDPDIVG